MAEAVIQTYRLTKIYHHPFFFWKVRARALTELDLRVERGEILGLLGPNGSGKSTTIKILLGLLFPTSGQAAVFGKRPTSVAIKARIGFLPEESYLYRFLDAEETLDFFGRLFGLPAAERRRRADALLELTGLRRERKRAVTEYSKGMQRRLGIATSLINDPELVVFDEPTSGLDPLGTRQVKDIILELKRKGKTVLLSSHLLADVEDVCDRAAILYGGRMQADGKLENLLGDATHTQITAALSEDDTRAVMDLLRKRLGDKADIRVQPPTERLEDYFLRIVRSAQERRLSTSGAEGAGQASDLAFLTQAPAEDPEEVLRRLARNDAGEGAPAAASDGAAAATVPAPSGTAKPAAPAAGEAYVSAHDGGAEARASLLSDLTSGGREEQAAAERRRAEKALRAPKEAPRDRALLDDLTKDN